MSSSITINGGNNEHILKPISVGELDEERRNRANLFIEKFQHLTGSEPNYIICTPGRVNLIGDHVDYHGFAVLPMAIKNSIWFGCLFQQKDQYKDGDNLTGSQARSHLNLLNVDSEYYKPVVRRHSFLDGLQLYSTHNWQNYILCAYYGMLSKTFLHVEPKDLLSYCVELDSKKNLLEAEDDILNDLKSCTLVIDSDLPKASGLSSSSALVCASAVAASLLISRSDRSQSESMQLDGVKLADCCSKFEHLVGTQGGGMDQAVIMTAQFGYAKYVQFVPELNCRNVRLPEGVVWLISHCGVSHAKAITTNFNTRVLETKLGAALIAKAMMKLKPNVKFQIDKTITLSQVKQEFFNSTSTSDLVEYIRKGILKETNDITLDDVCERLGMTKEELIVTLDVGHDSITKYASERLKILSRCEHVFEEAERVEQFKFICDTTIDINQLGQLMSESHFSLRDKYECSHPDLDKLVSVALEAGALGCRLTGAGWGGCVVTMVEARKSDSVMAKLKQLSTFTFPSEPDSGCRIIKVS